MENVSALFSVFQQSHFFLSFLCVLTQQTRSLLSVFEEDSGMLTNYTNQLLQALQRVFGAQVGNQKETRGANVQTQVVFQGDPAYVLYQQVLNV